MTHGNTTIQEFMFLLNEYYKNCKKSHPFFSDLAENTIKNYSVACRNLNAATERVYQALDSLDAGSTLTPAVAQAIVNDLIDTKGPGAAKVAVGALGSILSYRLLYTAHSGGAYNPFDYVKTPPSKPIEPWTQRQITEHLVLGDDFIRLLVSVLLETGQRLSDVTDLTADKLIGDAGAPILFQQKKTGTNVSVPLTEELRHISRSIYGFVDPKYFKDLNVWHALTGSSQSIRMTENFLRYRYIRDCDKLGIEALPLHGLRKNAVLRMIAAGATEFEIMAVTGHKSTSSLRHYTTDYNRDAAAREAVKKLEAYTHGK